MGKVGIGIGILLAALAMFAWGWFFWGMNTIQYETLMRSQDDTITQQFLSDQFPEEGAYFVPGFESDMDDWMQRSEKGPVAIIHLMSKEGLAQMDPVVMIKGFLLNLIGAGLLACLFILARPAALGYFRRVGLAGLVGLLVALMGEMDDAVWWHVDPLWKAFGGLYQISVFLIAGIVLALFVRAKRPVASEPAAAAIPDSPPPAAE